MGYTCPVCSDPQADGVHLANHLAFTAMVRGGDHESWLDEHVPDWASMDDEGLATEVTELAEGTEYPQVFEDTTGEHDHGHGPGESRTQGMPRTAELPDEDAMTRETAEVLDRARELTRERRQETDEE